jgi:hypothetical protein
VVLKNKRKKKIPAGKPTAGIKAGFTPAQGGEK